MPQVGTSSLHGSELKEVGSDRSGFETRFQQPENKGSSVGEKQNTFSLFLALEHMFNRVG